jgi:hypothetical protein
VDLAKSKKISLLEGAFGAGYLEAGEGNLHVSCPSCKEIRKDKRKLYVALHTGWYHCWVCGLSGKNINFLFRKYSPSKASACASLFPDDRPTAAPLIEEVPPPELPKDAALVALVGNDPDARDVFRYLRERGLSKMDMYRWRVCVSNEFKFRRTAIFPSFDANGKLNYYTGRRIDETKFKYKNANVPKRNVIFNEFDIDWDSPVLLVEGVFDAIKCPDNTVPVLGSSLSKSSELFMKLKLHESTVVVAFDEDAASKAQDTCKKLHAAGCTVYSLSVTGGDFGSKTKQEVKTGLKDMQPWSTISRISHKISCIKSGSLL